MTKLKDLGGSLDDAVNTVRAQVIPRARELDGFRGFIGLTERESGTFMSFTLWESEEAMRASEATANELRENVAQQLGAAEPTVKRWEAVILDVPAGVTA